MNYIFKCGRNFAAISNSVEADSHKHWMLQLFISSEEALNIEIEEESVTGKAILVNIDTSHTFSTKGEHHFTLLIDPTTELGRIARARFINNKAFYTFPYDEAVKMQKDFSNALKRNDDYTLVAFVQNLIHQLTTDYVPRVDERIIEVLSQLDCCVHEDEQRKSKHLADIAYLSESRLAHLFKEETGIPLKSYLVLHKLHGAYDAIFRGESITTSAMKAGFDTPSHLAATNKKMTGMSVTNIMKDSVFLKVF